MDRRSYGAAQVRVSERAPLWLPMCSREGGVHPGTQGRSGTDMPFSIAARHQPFRKENPRILLTLALEKRPVLCITCRIRRMKAVWRMPRMGDREKGAKGIQG